MTSCITMIENLKIIEMLVRPSKGNDDGPVQAFECGIRRTGKSTSNAWICYESRQQVDLENVILTLAFIFVAWPVFGLTFCSFLDQLESNPI